MDYKILFSLKHGWQNRGVSDLWIVEKITYIATFGIGISSIANGNFEGFFSSNCGDRKLISPNI